LIFGIAAAVLLSGWHMGYLDLRGAERVSTGATLVKFEPLPEVGAMCEWMPESPSGTLMAGLLPGQAASQGALTRQAPGQQAGGTAAEAASRRPPARVIKDPYAVYSSVAVDTIRNEVVMADENTFSILVYDRTTNTPARATMSEPKRMIKGPNTGLEYQCGIYIDPKSGDIYAVNNDTQGNMPIFSHDAKGDAAPVRTLTTPHTTFGITVDEEKQEMFFTIQDDAAIVVFNKMARDREAPLRYIQGEQTKMADPHGLALDAKNGLLFVTNYGSVNVHKGPPTLPRMTYGRRGDNTETWPISRFYAVPGSGKFQPPSITVYPKDGKGDIPPLREIQGPKTQLNWPTGIAYDPKRNEIFVANDTGDSVLVFDATANGDVAPKRVLQGPRSLIKYPVGVFIDTVHDELWTANFGNHSVTVHRPDAQGDTAPLRLIRSAPLNAPTPAMGNPHPVAFDTKREEILVPN
jgi:DNA-binding beta-propeller fold protein YncE